MMMMIIIIIVMCDTTTSIELCLEPSALAMLCQLSPSWGVYSDLTAQRLMVVSFDDDDNDDDDDVKHI